MRIVGGNITINSSPFLWTWKKKLVAWLWVCFVLFFALVIMVCCTLTANMSSTSSITASREKGIDSNSMLPASNLEKSRIYKMVYCNARYELSTLLKHTRNAPPVMCAVQHCGRRTVLLVGNFTVRHRSKLPQYMLID